MNIIILVFCIILYVAMFYFTLSVMTGMNYELENVVLLLCLFWPVTWAVAICATAVIPLCKLGEYLGSRLGALLPGDVNE